MKKIFFVMLFFVFFLGGCGINGFISSVEFSEFGENESFNYDLDTSNDFTLDVNVCKAKVEVLNYDGSNILTEVAYDNQVLRDNIDFKYSEGTLTIDYDEGIFNWNCIRVRENEVFIRISIPSVLNDVDIDLDSAFGELNLDTIEANKFSYDHINGDINIDHAKINVLDIDNVNGQITVKDAEGSSLLDVKSVNGNITLDQITYVESIKVDLTNGNINVTNAMTDETYIDNTNGRIKVETSQISKTLDIGNVNGDIDVNDVYDTMVNNDADLVFKVKLTNGEITVTDTYCETARLETTNGDISYTNSNKEFRIQSFTYKQFTGDTHFDVNATIEED